MLLEKNLLILEGDGIGSEICQEAVKIIEVFNKQGKTKINIDYALIGGSAYDQTKNPLPIETIDKAKASDSILLGAVGGPKWESLPIAVRPEKGLLAIRKSLNLFANLRPAVVFDELVDSSSLKKDIITGLDIIIVRELTGGIYFGQPRGVEILADNTRRGINTLVYDQYEVERIAQVGFELARKRGKKLCSVDKANVLESTEMWREIMQEIRDRDYQDIELTHMYVDNASMQLVRNPKQFDVIVTTNMFGDILSDTAAMLTGSLGMLPSASLGVVREDGKQYSLYEPVHGSAPDIAGKNIANPIATILSLSMMFKYSFNLTAESNILEMAIKNVLKQGIRTADIMSEGCVQVGTEEIGARIRQEIGI